MTMKKSSRWNTLRALAAVPVIALALLAFANNKSVAAVVTASVPQDRAVQSEMQSPELAKIEAEATTEAVEVEAEPEDAPAIDEANTEEQVTEETAPQSKKVYNSVEQMPEFPGGQEGLMRYLQQNVQYPPTAVQNNVQGRVIVQFIIDETGQVGDVEVVRSVSEEVDAEAVRVIKSMPKFEPGRQNGEPVAVWYTLPIAFKMQSKPMPQPQPKEGE